MKMKFAGEIETRNGCDLYNRKRIFFPYMLCFFPFETEDMDFKISISVSLSYNILSFSLKKIIYDIVNMDSIKSNQI